MNQTTTKGFIAPNERAIMNNEWEEMWKEVVIAYLTHGAPLMSSGHCI